MSLPPNINEITTGISSQDYYRIFNSGPNPPPVFNEYIGDRVLRVRHRSIASVSTPNFRSVKDWKVLTTNPYLKVVRTQDTPKSSVYIEATDIYGTIYYTIRENIQASTISPDIERPSATADDPTQKVISKLIESIGSAKADAATSMAELGKTAAHLAHTASRVAICLISLRKGRLGDALDSIGVSYTNRDVAIYKKGFSRAVREDRSKGISNNLFHPERNKSRVTDFVADTWLEYSYGWKPLLKDTFDIAQATAQALVDRNYILRYQTHKASNRKETTVKDESIGLSCSTTFTSIISVSMGVNYRIPNGAISVVDAFGLNNPLTVAWELIPFSFVVDWFLPVGDALKSLTAFSGLEFYSGWKTTKETWAWKADLKMKSFSSGGGSQFRYGDIHGSFEEFTLRRINLTDFPVYGFPKWKDPRSFAHAASAVSLLQSLFLRK